MRLTNEMRSDFADKVMKKIPMKSLPVPAKSLTDDLVKIGLEIPQ